MIISDPFKSMFEKNHSHGFFRKYQNRYLIIDVVISKVLNSKQSAKGYERIIREILRRCGYFIQQISCTELTNLGDLPKILVYHFWPHEYHFGSIIVLKGHVMQVFIVFHASNFCLFLLHSNYGWRPTPYNGLISTC